MENKQIDILQSMEVEYQLKTTSEQINNLKSELASLNLLIEQVQKDVEEFSKEVDELKVNVLTNDKVLIKLKAELEEVKRNRVEMENTANYFYDGMENEVKLFWEKNSSVESNWFDLNEINSVELIDEEGKKQTFENLKRRARLETLLYFNNTQIKIFKQFEQIKEDKEVLKFLDSM